MIDLHSRKVVGWAVTDHMRTELVTEALHMALTHRRPAAGSSSTPTAAAQYTAIKFSENLALQGISPSIGSVGDAYDNALMECINGLYKTECIRTQVFHQGPYRTIGDVEYATAGWVDWYNNRRLHSSISMTPPAEHEQAYYAALNREPQPA